MDKHICIYWTSGRGSLNFPEERGETGVASEAKLLTVQFLKWIAERPRRYAELRDAWSSTCPLNCAWEDAIA